MILAAVIVVAAMLWGTTPSAGVGQMKVPPKTPFTKGQYYLYVQPWGGESYAPTRMWSRNADSAIVDFKHFPANTLISWRWPPFPPRNDVGVWAYDALSYGNYDGSSPEQPVVPIKVKDLKALAQSFDWSMSNRFGDGNVLTEFYIDPPTVPVTAHKVEIGFFLHVPDNTRRFFESVPLVGHYVDDRGRHWTVRKGGTFCMFAPDGYRDIPSGGLDMLHALRWLRSKGVVGGDDIFPGLAFGAEAVQGFGQLRVNRWQVVMK
ncbi:hypothetical protein [Sphingomonas abietis]|uniref:DUF3750 domain-containing protein n=1 Tax=Sphingomonas abietis TaxID=3012344 RepID=A0ABY7NH47_9SPHN|nr:hypothetical protein [Sphingomonas abietis]WBO20859.1 hypothetical protein PBT88_11610 [Sphingomonas abietis]